MKKTKEEVYLETLNCVEPTDESGEGLDKITLTEVANNNGLILYEFDNIDTACDSPVDEYTINELFPDFQVDETKGYLIEKDKKF